MGEHCKVFFSKLNVSKLVRACDRARLFPPTVYLYIHDKQYDNAVKVMMDHAPAFENDLFLDAIVKVRNAEIIYKAIGFFLNMHPLFFTRLMEVVEEHVDHSRVVSQLRRTSDWALQIGQPYLKNVQKSDLSAINEALNELYIIDEDYSSLRMSIDKFKNFNMIALAQKLASHELLEFRRISAYVYRCNRKWSQSIELSKGDKMWKDCIDTANESCDAVIIEKLLRFFCEKSEKECFCAALYTCYAHISPDVVLELGWVNGYHDFIMPFFIQTFKNTHMRLKSLEEKTKQSEENNTQDEVAGTYGTLNSFNSGVLMLENGGSGMMPPPINNSIDMSGFGVPTTGIVTSPNGIPPQMSMQLGI